MVVQVRGGAAYPRTEEVDVALRDGSSIHLRPARPDDEEIVRNFLEGLSQDSVAFRFFGLVNLEHAAHWSCDVDYENSYALVAEQGPDRSVIAHGTYVRTAPDTAEVAFVVADAAQGHGIASVMLVHLAAVAARHGIAHFIAEVLPNNHKMIGVFRDSGFPVTVSSRDGSTHIAFPTSLSEAPLAAFDVRERTAAAGAVRCFLEPASVAVIGASRRPDTVGAEVLRNIVAGGYRGRCYPVNPHAHELQGLTAYPSAAALPEAVDLAVIVVPADAVGVTARDCAAAGVRALLVISAGFAEAGPAGVARQAELLSICRESGMRLIGPNCLGVLNTADGVRLNATFAAHPPPAGTIGFLSQSGGLGIALIEAAGRLGIGLSSFVSVGDKADISGNDLLEYWEQDPATDLILLYLESFGNARRFARIARRVSATKPILAVKSGRSPAGARATSSHTGALISASDASVDALFRQAGVIRADTIGELLDTAALLEAQPVPDGNRVAIVTNGGGPGILCADSCQAAGLDVVELAPALRAELAAFLPAGAATANPIDMIATATAADYRRVIETLIAADACDAVVTLFVPPLMTEAADVAREVSIAASGAGGVTIASVYMDGDAITEPAEGVHVPRFGFPEDAVRALAQAARYGRWRTRPTGTVWEPPECRHREASDLVASRLADGPGWLTPADCVELLSCYGIPLADSRVVHSARAAATAAQQLGLPVALKAIAPALIHKSDAGAVHVGLRTASAVRAAAAEIRSAVEGAGMALDGLLVQSMAEPGVELLLGVVHDDTFGPVIACGAGGTATELLGDASVRITPLSDLDAHEMVRSLRTFPLLDGYRGRPACDVAAVEDVLLRLSALVERHPEVAELDLNPLIVSPRGAIVVDARIRLAQPAAVRPLGALRA